jgi:hypothetical protein
VSYHDMDLVAEVCLFFRVCGVICADGDRLLG